MRAEDIYIALARVTGGHGRSARCNTLAVRLGFDTLYYLNAPIVVQAVRFSMRYAIHGRMAFLSASLTHRLPMPISLLNPSLQSSIIV